MFNPANLASEIFGILRSFDYVVNIFDFDGNRVYEPEEARRFFASPKNITVSIHEDGENSTIKMFLSKSTSLNEVTGLISTMRVTASKFGILFNVRKYERELRPVDLAPNATADYETGLSSTQEEITEVTPEKLDSMKAEIVSLGKEITQVIGKLKKKRKVKESMENSIELTERLAPPMTPLPALGCEVETDAWEDFKNDKMTMLSAPEDFDAKEFRDPEALRIAKLQAVARKAASDSLGNMLSRVADAIANGSTQKVLFAISDRAIDLGYKSEELTETRGPELIHLPKLNVDVELGAWEDFKNGKLSVKREPTFQHNMGQTGNVMAYKLRQIAAVTVADGMANMFGRVADAMENHQGTPLMQHVANVAIKAVGQPVAESVIMTESLMSFGRWFDSMTVDRLLEGSYPLAEEDNDSALPIAYKAVESEFDAKSFIEAKRDSFESDTVDCSEVESVLSEYIRDRLDAELDGVEYPKTGDIADLTSNLLPDVCAAMEDSGYTVTGCEENETVEEALSLNTEDVLLPNNPADDLTQEVTNHDDNDIDRIVQLSRGRTTNYADRTQP